MNRQQRRKAARDDRREMLRAKADFDRDVRRDGIFDAHRALSDTAYMSAVVERRKRQREAWDKNGITEDDLREQYQRGYAAATKELTEFVMNSFYSSAAIALKRIHGFGEDEILDVLDEMQRVMTEEITSYDLIARCKEETGLDILTGIEDGFLR